MTTYVLTRLVSGNHGHLEGAGFYLVSLGLKDVAFHSGDQRRRPGLASPVRRRLKAVS